jgi:hypothetical protein
MEQLKTLSGTIFQLKEYPDGELIIYPPEKGGSLQKRSAIVITSFTQNLVKIAIKSNGQILMGASRDKPPINSLGTLLKKEKQSPQQLSYLTPIMVQKNLCTFKKIGKAFVVCDLKETGNDLPSSISPKRACG